MRTDVVRPQNYHCALWGYMVPCPGSGGYLSCHCKGMASFPD